MSREGFLAFIENTKLRCPNQTPLTTEERQAARKRYLEIRKSFPTHLPGLYMGYFMGALTVEELQSGAYNDSHFFPITQKRLLKFHAEKLRMKHKPKISDVDDERVSFLLVLVFAGVNCTFYDIFRVKLRDEAFRFYQQVENTCEAIVNYPSYSFEEFDVKYRDMNANMRRLIYPYICALAPGNYVAFVTTDDYIAGALVPEMVKSVADADWTWMVQRWNIHFCIHRPVAPNVFFVCFILHDTGVSRCLGRFTMVANSPTGRHGHAEIAPEDLENCQFP